MLTSSLSEEQLAHVKECNGRCVSSDQPVELVVMNGGKPEPFAVLQPGQLVQLKEINDPNLITSQYLPLDGMDQEGGAQVLVQRAGGNAFRSLAESDQSFTGKGFWR